MTRAMATPITSNLDSSQSSVQHPSGMMPAHSECHSRGFDLSTLSPSPYLDLHDFLDPMDLPWAEAKPLVQWVPLIHGEIGRSVRLRLDGAHLVESRLPPSLFQGRLTQPGLLIAFGMTPEHLSFVNGRPLPPDGLMFGGLNSFFLSHWPYEAAPLQSVGAIFLPQRMVSPDWPSSGRLFGVLPVAATAMARLRAVLREALAVGSHSPQILESETVRAAILDRVGEAVSACFQTAPARHEGTRDTLGDHVDIYLNIVKYVDDNYSKSFSMRDIAADLRISERTIHTVMTRLQGMTLKSYLKLQRLREVRRNLLYGDAEFLVKQAALKSGFMHQGRFAREYFQHFGETPSATLARRVKI
ncbi:AraC family transcriptional regulator [Pinisolibacter aquiterrae]|uniref:AraC family transcriptional regulator n=1 Tax=Pinisolibacter aquiterrae TaxID=2815579 RepID=UPI001C3D1441|nr:AraC family transcriptional regulator [Pinisolibacter aquiterrae]MBV5266843.1 AraC family transcriptional regulator [Pinisolibacter aquiterrae]MCC8234843.1 helix-turn-helix domain-containing protein [Pinisolibacter aquiterrae]